MCDLCKEEDELIVLLERAKEDRSLLTDDILDDLARRIQFHQDQRLDQD